MNNKNEDRTREQKRRAIRQTCEHFNEEIMEEQASCSRGNQDFNDSPFDGLQDSPNGSQLAADGSIQAEPFRQLLWRLADAHTRPLVVHTMCDEINQTITFKQGHVHEIDGDFGAGKTQLCYSILARFLHENPGKRAAWISRNRTFDTVAFLRHYHRGGYQFENTQQLSSVLDRILVFSVEDRYEFLHVLEGISTNFAQLNLRMLIVDDIDCILYEAALFYVERNGYSELSNTNEKLHLLAKQGIGVVITNHLITLNANRVGPMLGGAWARRISSHIGMFCDDGENRQMSVREADGTITYVKFKIMDDGIFREFSENDNPNGNFIKIEGIDDIRGVI